ncbi:MAG: aminotransferase class I/II-fold pyridoxal phosphate-dependent enzyme [Alphaproteobacteria bacterium]
MADDGKLHPDTVLAQGLGWEDEATGAVVPPVHLTTTYARNEAYELPDGRSYARPDGKAVLQAEAMLSALEGAAAALSFGSGLAACTAPFHALKSGDHAVAPASMYHGMVSWLKEFPPAWGIKIDFVPPGDMAALQAALKPGKTKLVWIETPSNPTWIVTDIAAAADLAHAAGAALAVDSTSATPILTRPLALGADLVCHSATKYLNGHSDVLAGMLACREDTPYWRRIVLHRALAGPVLGALDAYLLTRGMKTLHLRVARQCDNAMALARFLKSRPEVSAVRYPGLEDDPGHAIAKRQMAGGFGGMLSFHLAGGRQAALGFCGRLTVIKRATSLGGTETLVEHRHSIEPPETEVPEDMLRLSAGIEDADDLIADMKAAFTAS